MNQDLDLNRQPPKLFGSYADKKSNSRALKKMSENMNIIEITNLNCLTFVKKNVKNQYKYKYKFFMKF